MEYSNKNFEERNYQPGVQTKTSKEITKPIVTKTLKNEITKPGVQ